jgi:hypothetical protein
VSFSGLHSNCAWERHDSWYIVLCSTLLLSLYACHSSYFQCIDCLHSVIARNSVFDAGIHPAFGKSVDFFDFGFAIKVTVQREHTLSLIAIRRHTIVSRSYHGQAHILTIDLAVSTCYNRINGALAMLQLIAMSPCGGFADRGSKFRALEHIVMRDLIFETWA